MKINRNLLPLKGHYFFFLGSLSPILPFLMVIVRQLGIPVFVQGTIGAVILVCTIIVKPIIAGVADAFPKFRKGIFIFILSLMVSCYCSIAFLPSMHSFNRTFLTGRLVAKFSSSLNNVTALLNITEVLLPENVDNIHSDNVILLSPIEDKCYIDEAWDCQLLFDNYNNDSIMYFVNVPKVHWKEHFESKSSPPEKVYYLEDAVIPLSYINYSLRLECAGGLYTGDNCPPLMSNYAFWIYILLLTVAYMSFATSNSISDAICLDSVALKGDYGNQRAWGTVGWGLMAPLSGLLVDRYSGNNIMKNFSPAFVILFIYGIIDIILVTAKLKVPHLKEDIDVWKAVKPLLRKPGFVIFLFFVILNGSFDGIVASYIFVLQEDMAKEKHLSYMQNMKFIQGMTVGVMCFFEALFMWALGWFLKKMTATTLTSVVFFLYIFRLFGLAFVSAYGPIWATLLTEVLNGPCYGLGYTAIVIQAGHLTPPGTSTTIQSVANICYESLGYALASLFGGVLYAYLGAPGIYFVFGGISVFTFILHIIAAKWIRTLEAEVAMVESNIDLKEKKESLLPTPSSVAETLYPIF